jgi:hypothetical protein
MHGGQLFVRRIRKLGSAVAIKGKSLVNVDVDSSEQTGIENALLGIDRSDGFLPKIDSRELLRREKAVPVAKNQNGSRVLYTCCGE